jgi:hypothetical protein
MKTKKIGTVISVLLNIAVAAATFFAVIEGWKIGDGTAETARSLRTFRYFTTDSNILSGISCAALAVYTLIHPKKDSAAARFFIKLKFVGVCSVMLTFLVVIFFLGPNQGYGYMLSGANLWLHAICPLAAFAGFLLFDGGLTQSGKGSLIGALPTLLYGAVYFCEVVLLKRWPDFYGFNAGGKWYISLVAVIGGAALFSFLLSRIKNLLSKKSVNV